MGDKVEALVALAAAQDFLVMDRDEQDLVVSLAKGKLDWSPKHNWVEDEGGLPKGIEDMAVHMMQNSGLTRQHAIAASVQRAKVLAAKGDARWVKEVAQWEKMKASAAAKRAAK